MFATRNVCVAAGEGMFKNFRKMVFALILLPIHWVDGNTPCSMLAYLLLHLFSRCGFLRPNRSTPAASELFVHGCEPVETPGSFPFPKLMVSVS